VYDTRPCPIGNYVKGHNTMTCSTQYPSATLYTAYVNAHRRASQEAS